MTLSFTEQIFFLENLLKNKDAKPPVSGLTFDIGPPKSEKLLFFCVQMRALSNPNALSVSNRRWQPRRDVRCFCTVHHRPRFREWCLRVPKNGERWQFSGLQPVHRCRTNDDLGGGTAGSGTVSGIALTATQTVYGRIRSGQNKPVGGYSDSITMAITFRNAARKCWIPRTIICRLQRAKSSPCRCYYVLLSTLDRLATQPLKHLSEFFGSLPLPHHARRPKNDKPVIAQIKPVLEVKQHNR